METLYYIFIWLVMILFVLLVVGLMRPRVLQKLYAPIKKPSVSRKLVIATLLPALIVSMIGISVFEPENVRAERALREEQAQQDRIEVERATEEARLAEIEQERKNTEKEEARQKAELEAKQKADEKARKAKEQRERELLAEQEAAAARQRETAQEQAAQQRIITPDPTPAPTPPPAPRPPAPTPAPQPSPAPRSYVHPGSFCSPPGSRGVFKSGNPAICAIDSKGLRYRWQSP